MAVYRVPVFVYIEAEDAADALESTFEECEYLSGLDNRIVSIEVPENASDAELQED